MAGMAGPEVPAWRADPRRPQLPDEWNTTPVRPERVRADPPTQAIATCIKSLGRDRAAGPAATLGRGMRLTLKPWVPKSSARLADTPIALAAMFDRADWCNDDGPPPPQLELFARYELSSALDRHALGHYLDLTNQGSGGKMAQTLFIKRRNEAREAYSKRIWTCPALAYVDWTDAETGGPTEGFSRRVARPPTDFSRVNLGDLSPEDLWVSYENHNAAKPVDVHWEMVRDAPNEWATFRDRVAAARGVRAGLRPRDRRSGRRTSSVASEPATLVVPVCPRDVLAFPGGRVAMHTLASSKAMAAPIPADAPEHTTVEREAIRVLVQPTAAPVSMIGRWLCNVEKQNRFYEIPCLVGEFGAAPINFAGGLSMEVILVDAAGTILRRSVFPRCGLMGTAFRKPGAYAKDPARAKRRAVTTDSAGRPTARQVGTPGERAAIRRTRAHTGAGAELWAAEKQARIAVRVASTMESLPLVARGDAGLFSGISFEDEIGKKPRTKAYTAKTRPRGASWHFWPHILGPMIDYGGSVSSRLQPFLKKRGTQGNMTKLTKLELVRRMVEARDYLETRRDLRPDHVRPIVDEIAAILARYKATDRLDHHRYAAARMITAVDIIRDPHAQRDQSSSGPQALREQAAVAQMARCVLAEAAALGVKRVKVPPPDTHNVFGWTYVQAAKFETTSAALDAPVRISVAGRGTVVDSATLDEGTDARRGAGFAALLLRRACDASLQSEILRRSLETPLGTADREDREEAESAKRRIYASTNLLRTALSKGAYAALAKRLAFFEFGQ